MFEIKEMGAEKRSKTLKKEVFSLSATNRYGKVNFRCTKRKNHGNREYRLVAQPKNEKRIDLLFETEIEARQSFYKWQSENNPCGMSFRVITTTLTDEQLRDATQAFDRIPDGVTLSELISQYELKKEVTSISLKDAWEEYRILNTWTPKNRDGRWTKKPTVMEQEYIFRPIVKKLGWKQLKNLKAEELSPFWQKQKFSDRTRLNHFKKIKAFFSWCQKKNYHHKDILALELTPKVPKTESTQVLTLSQAENLLEVASRPKFIKLKPFIALSLLAGLRAGEIHGNWDSEQALTWDDFNLNPEGKEIPYLALPFVGKMKSSRRVELPQKLVEILIDAKDAGMEVVPSKNGVNLWKKLRKESGLSKFKPNVLRHTAISFFYRHNPFTNQETLEENLMDKQFGNGEDVRDRHYKNVAKMTIADAQRFWAYTINLTYSADGNLNNR